MDLFGKRRKIKHVSKDSLYKRLCADLPTLQNDLIQIIWEYASTEKLCIVGRSSHVEVDHAHGVKSGPGAFLHQYHLLSQEWTKHCYSLLFPAFGLLQKVAWHRGTLWCLMNDTVCRMDDQQ